MKAAVITVSDGCFAGAKRDVSGPALARMLSEAGWQVLGINLTPDETDAIRAEVGKAISGGADLVVLTGGTGISPRDVTPEAVRPMLDKEPPGVSELMRLRGLEQTERAALSRSLAGSVGRSLVVCLPGSVKGAVSSLTAILSLLPHAVDLLHGRTSHGN